MSPALLDPPLAREPRQPSLFEDHGRVRLGWRGPAVARPLAGDTAPQRETRTLNDVVAAAWEGLVAGERVPCLVCGGRMSAPAGETGSAAPQPAIGCCADCGTSLS